MERHKARQASWVVLVTVLGVLVGLSSPAAAASQRIESSSGPLTRVEITDDLNCAVSHAEDTAPEFYEDTACATLLAVDGTLYRPMNIPLAGAAEGTPYTPVSQSGVSGSGSAADPYRIVTVVALGSSGLQITQTDSYVVGEESYRTDVRITNTASAARSVTLWRAGDCYLQDSDGGFGSVDVETGAVACVAPDPDDPTVPGDRIIQWLPLSDDSSYYEAGYGEVWAHIGEQLPFPNVCQCDEYQDNAAGLSWQLSVPSRGSVLRSHLTTFSPLGRQPLPTTKTADDDHSAPGATNGYTITVSNPNAGTLRLNSITDTLPDGFGYVAGSTTGATTADPVVSGGQLTWSGPVAVPASGQVSVHFEVVVASTTGTYYNTAGGGVDQPFTVSPTGDTAPITVSTDPDPTPDPADPDPTADPQPTPGPAPGDPQLLRLWGAGRIATAVALSRHSRPDGSAGT
ncbi:MAG: DUF11 domain-containing protein, partial [Actinomycetota bacterium]|nr:DUF11 domain-containing protein [Actinomycetota bacterium]